MTRLIVVGADGGASDPLQGLPTAPLFTWEPAESIDQALALAQSPPTSSGIVLRADQADSATFVCLATLTAKAPEIPVIVVVETADSADQGRLLEAGAVDVLSRATLGDEALIEALFRAAIRQAESGNAGMQTPLGEVVARVPLGIYVTDAGGHLQYANPRGAGLLRAGDGLKKDASNVLRGDDSHASGILKDALSLVASAEDGGIHAFSLERESLHMPLQALAFNLGEGRATLLVFDPEQPVALSEPILRQLFGFTRAEARVAARLAAGG
ncbi:MAG: hypothetical protein ACPGO3_12995, partial [Magnetospiraceae bacterium]